jgi:hypothetical protein
MEKETKTVAGGTGTSQAPPTPSNTTAEAVVRFDDRVLDELQQSIYYSCHSSDYKFRVYAGAQGVRDKIFRLIRKVHRIPDESIADDLDIDMGSVLKTQH